MQNRRSLRGAQVFVPFGREIIRHYETSAICETPAPIDRCTTVLRVVKGHLARRAHSFFPEHANHRGRHSARISTVTTRRRGGPPQGSANRHWEKPLGGRFARPPS